jgi:hypothetical protein
LAQNLAVPVLGGVGPLVGRVGGGAAQFEGLDLFQRVFHKLPGVLPVFGAKGQLELD